MENNTENENDKIYIIAFSYGWYFEDYESMSTEKIPNAVLTSRINDARKFTNRDDAQKVAKKYYGGYVLEASKLLSDCAEK